MHEKLVQANDNKHEKITPFSKPFSAAEWANVGNDISFRALKIAQIAQDSHLDGTDLDAQNRRITEVINALADLHEVITPPELQSSSERLAPQA